MTRLVGASLLIFMWLGHAADGAQDTAGVGVIRGTVVLPDGAPGADVAVCVRTLDRCVTDLAG